LAHLFGKSHNESERTLCWLLGHPFKKSLFDHNNYAFQAPFLRTDGPCSQHKDMCASERSLWKHCPEEEPGTPLNPSSSQSLTAMVRSRAAWKKDFTIPMSALQSFWKR
jgi:hypothetical protein